MSRFDPAESDTIIIHQMNIMHFTIIRIFALIAIFALGNIRADVDATNERSGEDLAHTLKCQKPSDISKSPIPGYLSVLISEKPMRQVRHLPVSSIEEINVYSYGVFIEFSNQRMKNGQGYMTTVVYVPSEVMEPTAVVQLIRACREN